MTPLRIFEDITELSLYRIAAYADGIEANDTGIIEICSHGGFVFCGNAAAQKIGEAQARGCRFVARIFGVAASSAADVALMCDRIEMAQDAAIMVHSAWNGKGGKDDGIQVANMAQLSVIRKRIPDYTEKDLQKDRWFTAQQALEVGLCDSIISTNAYEEQARLCACYLSAKQKGVVDMDEEKKEVVEEKKEVEEVEENREEEAPSVEDVIEKIVERIENIEGRIVALEGACGVGSGRREETPEARRKALYNKITASIKAVCAPCADRVVVKEDREDPKAALEKFKAKYPNFSELCKE